MPTTESTPELRKKWRDAYHAKKAKRASQSTIPSVAPQSSSEELKKQIDVLTTKEQALEASLRGIEKALENTRGEKMALGKRLEIPDARSLLEQENELGWQLVQLNCLVSQTRHEYWFAGSVTEYLKSLKPGEEDPEEYVAVQREFEQTVRQALIKKMAQVQAFQKTWQARYDALEALKSNAPSTQNKQTD